MFDYHIWHKLRNKFSAFHKTNISENEYPYLYRDYDLPPVGLLNPPILSYHFHFSRTWQNVPRNFSINFHGNWVETYIVFMFLEILYPLNQIVLKMNKSLFGYREKCILSVTGVFLSLWGGGFVIWVLVFFTSKEWSLLNVFPVQHKKNIIFAPTMPYCWTN